MAAKKKIANKDKVISDLRTSSDGMREHFINYATSASATCEDRTRVLATVAAEGGELLSEGTNLLRQCSKDHDDRTEELKTITKIWETK